MHSSSNNIQLDLFHLTVQVDHRRRTVYVHPQAEASREASRGRDRCASGLANGQGEEEQVICQLASRGSIVQVAHPSIIINKLKVLALRSMLLAA